MWVGGMGRAAAEFEVIDGSIVNATKDSVLVEWTARRLLWQYHSMAENVSHSPGRCVAIDNIFVVIEDILVVTKTSVIRYRFGLAICRASF